MRGRSSGPGRAGLAGIAGLALGCGDPPTVQLPLGNLFPVDEVRLGMTLGELRQARPDVTVVRDSATVVEELPRGRIHYAFAPRGRSRAPGRRSRLVYVERVDDEVRGDYARRRWDSLVVALEGELGLAPGCSAVEYGRLRWRRAMFREDGRPMAAAVDVVGVTIGDAGPGEAQVVTRAWLTDHVSPVSSLLAAPDGAAGPFPTGASLEGSC